MLEPEHYLEIADKVKSGEYFREGAHMYDIVVHDPMSERYLYILITALASMILLVTVLAMNSLYPLTTSTPFIVSSNNIVDDLPRIRSLSPHGEDPSAALLNFFVRNYVIFREEYNIDTFDRNINGVRSQSTGNVLAEFEHAVDPHNPESPTAMYQRHSTRTIKIVTITRIADAPEMEVVYDASVDTYGDVKKSRWQANIAFNYSGLALDENTGKVKPVWFEVTQYRSKRLQDIK